MRSVRKGPVILRGHQRMEREDRNRSQPPQPR
jgi:hypothetical protein